MFQVRNKIDRGDDGRKGKIKVDHVLQTWAKDEKQYDIRNNKKSDNHAFIAFKGKKIVVENDDGCIKKTEERRINQVFCKFIKSGTK